VWRKLSKERINEALKNFSMLQFFQCFSDKKNTPQHKLGRSNLSYTATIPVGYNNYLNLSIKLFVLSIDPFSGRKLKFTTNIAFVKYFFRDC